MSDYDKALTPGMVLLEEHRKTLYGSRLVDETINEIGFISSSNSDSYLEPIKDLSGKNIRGYRARYNEEVIRKNKYPSKEECTPKYRPSKDLGNAFFYPHLSSIKSWVEISKDLSVPIYITEGVKKAALLAQQGYAAVGILGVWNWKESKKIKNDDGVEEETSEPISDFKDIVWKKRKVYIVFDSDKYKNINVLFAEARLKEYLVELGADVGIMNLAYDPEAKGIDDFFVKQGENAQEMFNELVSKATPVSLGQIKIAFMEKRKDEIPHCLAEYIKEDKKIIYTYSGFYRFDQGYYKKIESEDFLKQVAVELIKSVDLVPKTYFLNETVKLLATYSLVEDKDFNPGNLHNVKNGILKINLEELSIDFIKHSSDHFLNYTADVEYDQEFDTSLATGFLGSIIPDENQRIIALEAIGFAIFPDLRNKLDYTKVNLEYGEGSNGKSIFTGFRERLIGPEVCASLPIDDLIKKDNRFAASSLYKKRANFSTENESSFIRESSVLKQISSGKSGDKVSVEFKHRQAFFANVNPVLFFSINKPPVLPASRTFALERRIQVINFPNRFTEMPKDGELKANPLLGNHEYTKPIVNGLLILVLDAVMAMLKRGAIWQVGVDEALRDAILKGSHKEQFFEENISFDPDGEIASDDLHHAYILYCVEEGIAQEHQNKSGTVKTIWLDENTDKACKTPHALSKWVNQRFKGQCSSTFLKNTKGNRVRGFTGIKLKNKNVEDELCNRASSNNAELSQNNQLHTCTDESEQLPIINKELIEPLKDIKMADVLKKELEKNAVK